MSDAERIRALEAENAALRRALEAPDSLRYRALFDNNGLGIALVDRDGRLIECNLALCAALGFSQAELRGGMIGTHTHPDDVAQDRRLFAELVTGERATYQYEKRYVRRDGTIFHGRITNSAVRDAGGQVLFVMRIVEDITARLEAERSLRNSRTLLFALIDQLPALIFAKDLEGRFLVVNRPFAATLGTTPEALVGRKPADFYPPEVADYFRARDQAVLAAEKPIIYEEPYRDPAGVDPARTMETTRFVLLDEARHPFGICGITYEVTARKRAEQERLEFERKFFETQKLESLGLMAGSIAHDFNNLLMTILGNASLALDEQPADTPARGYLAEIELAARRAADLTRQMLAYTGKSQLVFRPVGLNELIRETARLLASSVPRQTTLRYELDPRTPAVSGDATQLRQVVMNLLLNAAEAIGEGGGAVMVSTGALAVPAEAPVAGASGGLQAGFYALLEVADDGHGMDAAIRTRIFEPFFTTKFTGRGLGLAAVQGIVRAHGGTIEVESEPGRGSTFRIVLPATREAPGAEPAEPPVAALRGAALVADDEPEVLQVTSRMLRRLGLAVQVAGSFEEVVRVLQASSPVDFALVDLNLPVPGGDLIAALREVAPALPILLMSGHGPGGSAASAVPGAVAVVAKPFTLPLLAEAVRLALGGSAR